MMIPLVRFVTAKGDVYQSIERKEFQIELGEKVVARRIQLPLKLVCSANICHIGLGYFDSQITRNDHRFLGCGLEGRV